MLLILFGFFSFLTFYTHATVVEHIFKSSIILDTLAKKNSTDKGPNSNYVNPNGKLLPGHNYTQFYHFYFNPLRDKAFNLLEIGFFKGGSARMWEEYFPKANLFFLEINQEFIDVYGKDLSSRSKVFFVDQSNQAQLKRFAQTVKNGFDIIIDDGSHIAEHQIISFETLFSFLNKGGLYIIEDLHCTYKKGKSKTIDFMSHRVDDLNYISAKTKCADQNKFPRNLLNTLNIYQREILAVHFYSGICFIFKR